MAGIEWIIFSKNRTLQIKSCLLSLTTLSDVVPEDINILYQDEDNISYEPLKKEYGCRFIKQSDFYRDIMDIVEGTSKPLIGIMVDDLIVRDNFSASQIEGLMRKYKDLGCFSLRLGKNIKDRKAPQFEEIEPGIFSWRTALGLGTSWNYFWEISSSVYPKELVIDYLKRCSPDKITHPNPLESCYYKLMPNYATLSKRPLRALKHPRYILAMLLHRNGASKRMACYEKSRAFTQGINLVARGKNIKGKIHLTTEQLHKLFLKGFHIDFKSLKDIQNKNPNAGTKYFRVIGPGGETFTLPELKVLE